MKKYVFVQDDPFFLPVLLDKFLREFAETTAGINVQSVAQGKRSVFETALTLRRVYGLRYFLWKLRRFVVVKAKARLLNDLLRSTRRCYSVSAVARKYGLEVTRAVDVNSEAFRDRLARHGVELVVSISGTQLYRRELREQIRAGIINCHGGLLPEQGMSLSEGRSYASIVGVESATTPGQLRVVPSDPDASILYQALLGPVGPDLGQMPSDRPALDAQRIQLVRDWIAAGAPEN